MKMGQNGENWSKWLTWLKLAVKYWLVETFLKWVKVVKMGQNAKNGSKW